MYCCQNVIEKKLLLKYLLNGNCKSYDCSFWYSFKRHYILLRNFCIKLKLMEIKIFFNIILFYMYFLSPFFLKIYFLYLAVTIFVFYISYMYIFYKFFLCTYSVFLCLFFKLNLYFMSHFCITFFFFSLLKNMYYNKTSKINTLE